MMMFCFTSLILKGSYSRHISDYHCQVHPKRAMYALMYFVKVAEINWHLQHNSFSPVSYITPYIFKELGFTFRKKLKPDAFEIEVVLYETGHFFTYKILHNVTVERLQRIFNVDESNISRERKACRGYGP